MKWLTSLHNKKLKLPDGKFIKYTKFPHRGIGVQITNGKIRKIIRFCHNKPHGIQCVFDETGRMIKYCKMFHGKFHGEYREITNNIKIESFYVNNKIHGLRTVYNNNNIHEIYSYKNGVLDGPQMRFNSNNGLHALIEYKNNQYNGEAIIWYENKNLQLIHNYENNKLHGIQLAWYPDLKQKYILNYNHGVLIDAQEWDRNGKKIKTPIDINLTH